MRDLIIQHLFQLISEPILEVYADLHSFGGRFQRSSHQALVLFEAALNNLIRTRQGFTVGTLEIKGMFGNAWQI